MNIRQLFCLPILAVSLNSCAIQSPSISSNALLGGPTSAERATHIAAEPKGSFYYGRRYYVQKTRFWGYLREPSQSAQTAKLVMMNESKTRVPDRLSEKSTGKVYGYDANYEYRIYGHYTGAQVYDPNSNQILPEFLPTRFELLEKNPGWLFTPADRYNARAITMRPGRF